MRRLGMIVALAAATALALPGVAVAHRLSIKDADRAITRAIRLVAEGAGYDQAWAGRCERRSAHKVGCTAFTKDWVPNLGAMATCRRAATATYRDPDSRRIAVGLSKTVRCRYTYPEPPAECDDDVDNDGDGLTDYPDDPDCTGPDDDNEGAPLPLPMPETQLTEAPENGSVIEGNSFPDGMVIAFVPVGMASSGGTDPFFECKQDDDAFAFCGMGQAWSTSLVFEGAGMHSLEVRACSGWGDNDPVCDSTPEPRWFEVVSS